MISPIFHLKFHEMGDITKNNYLKFHPNQVELVRRSCGYDNEKSMQEAIGKFRDWIEKQNHFVFTDFDNKYLEAFILNAKGSIEKAKQRLDKRCTYGTLMADKFKNIDMDVTFKNFEMVVKHLVCPLPTKDHYRVLVAKWCNDHVDKLDLMDYVQYMVACSEYGIRNDCCVGYECVIDFEKITNIAILAKLNPISIQKIMSVTIDCFGTKIKSIHFINASKFVDALIAIVKQGMPNKIANRIRVHKSSDTVKEYIDKEYLPSDYGGDLECVEKLYEQMSAELRRPEVLAALKESEAYCTDEAKRLTTTFNEEYLGIPGSFRSMKVD